MMINARTANRMLTKNVTEFKAGKKTRSALRKLDKVVKTAIDKRKDYAIIDTSENSIHMSKHVIETVKSKGYRIQQVSENKTVIHF